MELRDEFALKAFEKILDNPAGITDPNEIAQAAYQFADAMLCARKSKIRPGYHRVDLSEVFNERK